MNTRPKILIVDDNEAGRYALARCLRQVGDVLEAATGADCLCIVQKEKPELVLLDIRLPDTSGIEVCRKLKSDPRTTDIPVIQISAQFTTAEHKCDGLESGADAYLTAPCEAREVLAHVSALLRIRRAEAELRTNEERFRAFFDRSPVGGAEADPETGRFVRVNRRFCEITGFTEEEMLGMTFLDITHPDDRTLHLPLHHRMVRGELSEYEIEKRYVRKDGQVVWAHAAITLIRDADGKPLRSIGIINDITERKHSEERLRQTATDLELANRALRESESRLARAQEIAHLGSWELDVSNNRLVWSDEVYRIFGLKPQEFKATYETFLDAVHPDDRAAVDQAYTDSLRQNRAAYEIEHRVIRKGTGEVRFLHERCQHFRDDQGQIVRSMGMVHDITERKAFEAELERLVAERTARLREMVAELEHFSYTITHDMRAPLRAMQAFGQVLADEHSKTLDNTGRDFLRRIIQASKRMDVLITEALNYSKIVQAELVLEAIDPKPLLTGMLESYPQFQPPQAEIEVLGHFPPVLASTAGLTQCFSNLLGNAVKFVEPGKTPKVRVWAEEHGDTVRLWFEDNGIGIADEQKERIFGLFQRLSKEYEGTGVGLALVRKVVGRMRGQVGFESTPGQGSRFWIQLARAKH